MGHVIFKSVAKDYDLDITWKGFELHPEVPSGGVPMGLSMAGQYKKGFEMRIAPQMRALGIDAIVPEMVPNTQIALELSELARDEGKFDTIHEALFVGYFEKGMDIGDPEQLLALGKAAGLSENGLRECFIDRKFHDRIAAMREEAMENLVTGVPTFVINGFPIIGAQEPAIYRNVIEKMMKKLALEK